MENWKYRYQWNLLSQEQRVALCDALNKINEEGQDVPFRLFDPDDEWQDDMPDLCGPASYGIYSGGTLGTWLVWNPEYAGPFKRDPSDGKLKPPGYIEDRQRFMRSLVPYVLFHDVVILCDEPLI